jgi:hypothetical protein
MAGAGQEDQMAKAVRLVLAMLPQDSDATSQEVADACDAIHAMLTGRGDEVDLQVLRREVEARVTVWQEDSTGLADDTDHIEWLPAARSERTWDFWERYRRYNEDVKLMPKRVVWRLGGTTDRILGKLEDPKRHGSWHREGLVVGNVQSGKTANYIGLICKAADAGYKLIVVLAGIDNSLRSQTQLRIDEGFLGFDTQYQKRYDDGASASSFGVGAMPGAKKLKVASLTTSAESGDFKRAVAANTNIPIGDYPVVLVIKKHRSILNYLRKWIVEYEGRPNGPDGKKKTVPDVPLLVIDDEADNASVNVATADEDTKPSSVNAGIRQLLESFDKSAYVGYTATPFANIYIDPSTEHDQYGLDIFPRHFIESLPAPSNYLGPERVFGLQTEDPEDEDIEPLPIVRQVKDYESWMPERHKKDWVPPADLPDTLTEAIKTFVLTCAARRARGQATEHNSMLVHVTRFVDVQNRVAEEVEDELRLVADRVRYGDRNSSEAVEDELRDLWERDFVPTSAWFPADQFVPVDWTAVWAEVRPAVEKIEVRVVNGSSRDALQYYEHRRDGLYVIAIGGNKLSRGLTLEGLSVSYYLRASKAYDTLLQMGRWFGYRPGYEDLCRLYTTAALCEAYREITSANDELRREFEEMAALGAKPEDFGLRVRASSAGLVVTAANKMRRGLKVKLSYSGDMAETVIFDLADTAVRGNFENLEKFISRLDAKQASVADSGSRVWREVSAEEVVDGFLSGYIGDRKAQRVKPNFIAEYIRRCQQVGELRKWTVRLVSSRASKPVPIGGYEIGPVRREPTNNPQDEGRYTIRRILSPADESSDLDRDQKAKALAATQKAAEGKLDKNGQPRVPKVPTGTPLRRERKSDQGLLLLYPLTNPMEESVGDAPALVGFAISFPFSTHQAKTEYVVNEIWQQQEVDDLFDDDEDAS